MVYSYLFPIYLEQLRFPEIKARETTDELV